MLWRFVIFRDDKGIMFLQSLQVHISGTVFLEDLENFKNWTYKLGMFLHIWSNIYSQLNFHCQSTMYTNCIGVSLVGKLLWFSLKPQICEYLLIKSYPLSLAFSVHSLTWTSLYHTTLADLIVGLLFFCY